MRREFTWTMIWMLYGLGEFSFWLGELLHWRGPIRALYSVYKQATTWSFSLQRWAENGKYWKDGPWGPPIYGEEE